MPSPPRIGRERGRGGGLNSWPAAVDPAARLPAFTACEHPTCCFEVQPTSTLHLQHLLLQPFLVWIHEQPSIQASRRLFWRKFSEKHLSVHPCSTPPCNLGPILAQVVKEEPEWEGGRAIQRATRRGETVWTRCAKNVLVSRIDRRGRQC